MAVILKIFILILKNHASAPVRKERSSSTSKAMGEASQNKFVEKGGAPGRVESFAKLIVARIVREIDLHLFNPSEIH